MAKRAHCTWILKPPAREITPAIAKDWLHRVYPKLSSLAGMASHPDVLRPPSAREEIHWGLSALSSDLRSIVVACAEAIHTGRSVRMTHRDAFPAHGGMLRGFRAMRRYAERHEYHVRGVLMASERLLARRVKAAAPFYRSDRLAQRKSA